MHSYFRNDRMEETNYKYLVSKGSMNMNKISFIHAADLHLDSPFVGLKDLPKQIFKRIQDSTFHALKNMIDIAIEKQVDFVIIAGDVYDGEDRSVRAQIIFRKELERLQEANIPVIIAHGNHDHLGGRWTKLAMPENVHVFPAHVAKVSLITKGGVPVQLYGFSYPKKHVTEKMIDQYVKIPGADYHIGVLHGHDSLDRSHYSYAPFHIQDLLNKEFDYWALGHIHKQRILHEEPYIIYPGNTQGRHKNETGKKGCYLVEMDSTTTSIEFIETASILWENITVTEELHFSHFDELYDYCIKMKENFRSSGFSYFLTVDFKLRQIQADSSLMEWLDAEEFLSLLQEGEQEQEQFVWITELNVSEQQPTFTHADESFLSEIKGVINTVSELNEPLSLLFDHPKTKRFIETLTEDEGEEIKQKAEKLLYQYLKY